MGLLDFLKPKKTPEKSAATNYMTATTSSAPKKAPPPSAPYAQWIDPHVSAPTAEWERRLNNYSERCARQLREKKVPLFRAKFPRDGKGAYRDAFWLIACDVDRANRIYYSSHFSDTSDPQPGYPPAVKKGEYSGSLVGRALLLTKSGILCEARFEGFMTRTGGVDDREMDLYFSDVTRPIATFMGYDYGWSNRGKWQSAGSSRTEFRERYDPRGTLYNDGRSVSKALTDFVNSGGKTRWPRGFVSSGY